ncbi:MAG: hypothetical protein R3Y09_12720 [Clostridia bacterium]
MSNKVLDKQTIAKNPTLYLSSLIISAMYIVSAFLIPFEKNAVFFMSFLFGLIAIVVGFASFNIAFKNETSPLSRFLGWPIFRVGYIYTLTQFVVSFIFMAAASVVWLWLAVLIQFLLLCSALLCLISADTTRNKIKKLGVDLKENTSLMLELKSRVKTLVDINTNPKMEKELEKILDEVKYSDVVSSKELFEVEELLMEALATLEESIALNDVDEFLICSAKFKTILARRNNSCKQYKK